jgi:hypothetical protein
VSYLLSNDTIFLFVALVPQHKGSTKEFDKQCLFGNDMYLIEDQVRFLLDLCDPDFPPKSSTTCTEQGKNCALNEIVWPFSKRYASYSVLIARYF